MSEPTGKEQAKTIVDLVDEIAKARAQEQFWRGIGNTEHVAINVENAMDAKRLLIDALTLIRKELP